MLNPGETRTGKRREEQAAHGLKVLTIVRRRVPTPSVVYDTYWRFAVERQEIYFRRLLGRPAPWTDDSVLREHKFTNAYRASDRVSQYLIQRVIYPHDYSLRDTVLRILLFKIFNKIETWEFLGEALGQITEATFRVGQIGALLARALDAGARIYSAAYIMPSGPASIRQPRKHLMHLELLADILGQRVPERLAAAKTMAEAYELLLSLPSIGPFLAYRFATDLNYSPYFTLSEMEFVMPGPTRARSARSYRAARHRYITGTLRTAARLRTSIARRRGLHASPRDSRVHFEQGGALRGGDLPDRGCA